MSYASQLGKALDLTRYIRESPGPFTLYKMAEDLEIDPRTAQRWLNAAEARGLVERDTKPKTHLWSRPQ